MVAAGSKCRACRGPAIIDLPRHNANFCAEHFIELCRRQVVKAIETVRHAHAATTGCWSPCRAARTAWRCGTC